MKNRKTKKIILYIILLVILFFIIYKLFIIYPYLKYIRKVKFPRCLDDIPYLTKFRCLKYIEDKYYEKYNVEKITNYICSNETPKKMINLRSQPFWDIPEINYYLLKNKKVILNELNSLSLENDFEEISSTEHNLHSSDYLNNNWTAFHLVKKFQNVSENQQICPLTTNIIQNMPSFFGSVFFSALKGGAKIPKHTGATNINLTCLLGLKNLEDTIFNVNGEEKKWGDHEIIIFDDSYEHEVINTGKSTRIILIIEIIHPDLNETEREILKNMYINF